MIERFFYNKYHVISNGFFPTGAQANDASKEFEFRIPGTAT